MPSFLEEIVDKVQKKKLYTYEKVYNALITREEENINIINNVIDNGDYSKLNISIKNVLTSNNELQKIAIKNLEKSKAFTNNILKNEVELFNIWSLIANQYKELNEKN
ncbi:hypothetical protein UM772_12185 [Staphylococcus aureus]|nr:hypothetical protein UM802_01820 [Staphylococcus aureus]WRM94298.1 hypothetical protein UM772_12185 [Staphylococcus aureus]WRN05056.1 hypothetical protein UM707_10370 [Staphylococcus aureus]WRN47854.1 hypothetical protein UM562_01845 [Staphylococcus aureus]